jgi:hypothetical protein
MDRQNYENYDSTYSSSTELKNATQLYLADKKLGSLVGTLEESITYCGRKVSCGSR